MQYLPPTFQMMGGISSFPCIWYPIIEYCRYPHHIVFIHNRFVYLQSEFVNSHPLLQFDVPSYSIAFYQNMLNPPYKFWFVINYSLHFKPGLVYTI